MDGNSFGTAMGDAMVGMAIFALIIGLLIGGGCALVLTSGCVPTVKIVWPAGDDDQMNDTERVEVPE